jgi:hypothetical protein
VLEDILGVRGTTPIDPRPAKQDGHFPAGA